MKAPSFPFTRFFMLPLVGRFCRTPVLLQIGVNLLFCTTLLLSDVQAQAPQSLCAKVRLEIAQELTLERQGFEARMTINNGVPDKNLTNIRAEIYFQNSEREVVVATRNPSDTSSSVRFFYRSNDPDFPLNAQGNMTRTVVAGGTSEKLTWLIIPRPDSTNQNPNGIIYYVGAKLTYTVDGEEQSVEVSPDYIFVKPTPALVLDYFLPGDVYGDDPFTPLVEPAVPFTLGLRIRNNGFAAAEQLTIESGQPRILSNDQGAPVGFRIQGSEINGRPALPTLLANVGVVPSQAASMVRWSMTSLLSGTFVSFNAFYSHSDLLGGQVTSLLSPPVTHRLVHDVLSDFPGRDNIKDFLAMDEDVMRVYESDAGTPDSIVAASQRFEGLAIQGAGNLSSLAMPVGSTVLAKSFFYLKATDPFNGQKTLKKVLRSDGKILPAVNAWFSRSRSGSVWTYSFNILDSHSGTESVRYTYAIETGLSSETNRAPVLGALSGRIIKPGEGLMLTVTASDPDGTKPAISVPVRPSGSTHTDNGNGSALFSWTPGPSQIGSYALKFVASDGSLTDEKSIRVIVTNSAKFEAWKEQYWPGVTDPNIVGNRADPDSDGLSNLYEYALGMDPTRSSLTEKPVLTKELIGGKHFLVLTYVRRFDDPDLVLNVIGSSSAKLPEASWIVQSNINTEDQTGVPSGFQRVKVTDTVALQDSSTGRFLRLRVKLVTP